MTRKLIYIVLIITAMFFCMDLFCDKVYATDGLTAEGGIDTDYYTNGLSSTDASGADKVKNIGNSVIGVIQVIGSIISVAVLAVLGIKYMMGSAEERAEYKKTMMPYLIGAIMVFAIVTIVSIIANISSTMF